MPTSTWRQCGSPADAAARAGGYVAGRRIIAIRPSPSTEEPAQLGVIRRELRTPVRTLRSTIALVAHVSFDRRAPGFAVIRPTTDGRWRIADDDCAAIFVDAQTIFAFVPSD